MGTTSKAMGGGWLLFGLTVGIGAAVIRDLAPKFMGKPTAAKTSGKVIMDAVLGGIAGSAVAKAFSMAPGAKAKAGVLAGTTLGGMTVGAITRYQRNRIAGIRSQYGASPHEAYGDMIPNTRNATDSVETEAPTGFTTQSQSKDGWPIQ